MVQKADRPLVNDKPLLVRCVGNSRPQPEFPLWFQHRWQTESFDSTAVLCMCGCWTVAKWMCLCECYFPSSECSKCDLFMHVWKCVLVRVVFVCVLVSVYPPCIFLFEQLTLCRHQSIGYLLPVFPCSKRSPVIGWSFIQNRLYSTHDRKLWTSMTLGCLVRSVTQTYLAASLLPSVIDMHIAVYNRTHTRPHTHTHCLARRRSHE